MMLNIKDKFIRFKVWWGVAGGSSAAYFDGTFRPTHSGMRIGYYLGSPGANIWRSGPVAIPNTNPGGNATVGFDFNTGYTNVTAQGGPATASGGGQTIATWFTDNTASYNANVISASVINGRSGTNATLYDSWVAPGVSPGTSTFDNTNTGPGAGGYTPSGAANPTQQVAAKNGLIKITVIED